MQDLETGKNIVFKGKIAWWYWLIVIGTNALLLYELFFSGDSIVLLLGVLIFCNVIYLPMLIRNYVVIDELNLDTTYEALVEQITVTNPSGSQILEIAVLDPDPQMACDISNAMSDTTAERVAEVMITDKPSTVDDAVVPKYPATPNTLKNTAIAGVIGMLLVMAVLLVNYLLDDRLKTEEDVMKYLELNTLASIPLNKGEKASKPKKKGNGKKAA